ELVTAFCAHVEQDLSLWQTFLLFLWTLSVLVRKFARETTGYFRSWFLESLGDRNHGEREEQGQERNPVLESATADVDVDESTSSVNGTLIQRLPDALVRDQLWLVLMRCPSVPLLQQLRLVSKSWNRFVLTTVEWNTWVFMRIDSPGYCRYLTSHGLEYQPFSLRYEIEVAAFRFLLMEDMSEIAQRVRYLNCRARGLPYCVSLSGCPPSVDTNPEYYDL
ncbi:hypothetical protein KC19_11G008200, partial [Ceratodon purpureus]